MENLILLMGTEGLYKHTLAPFTKIKNNEYEIVLEGKKIKLLVVFAGSKLWNPHNKDTPTVHCMAKEIVKAKKIAAFGLCASFHKEGVELGDLYFPNKFVTGKIKEEVILNEELPFMSRAHMNNEVLQTILNAKSQVEVKNSFSSLGNLSLPLIKNNSRNLTVSGIFDSSSFGEDIKDEDKERFRTSFDSLEMECFEVATLAKENNIELGVSLQVSDHLGEDNFVFSQREAELFTKQVYKLIESFFD